MPCEGGEAVKPASEMRLNNISAAVSTPQLKILCVVDKTPKDVTITAAWADFVRLRTLRTAQNRRESSGIKSSAPCLLPRHEPARFWAL